MKYVYWLISSIIFSSCVQPVLLVPAKVSYYTIDFKEYSDKNFLFTPYSYNGEYIPIGMIQFDIRPEAKYRSSTFIKPNAEWESKRLTADDVLKVAYEKVLDMGGDALVDFKVTVKYETVNEDQPYYRSEIPYYSVEGFAIKR